MLTVLKINCVPVSRFLKKLHQDIQHIENTTFSVMHKNTFVDVKFIFAELPNDMKMLCFIAGELSNSAKYFSTFGNVNKYDLNKITGTFSLDGKDCTWKPWQYKHRLAIAKGVEQFKSTLAKNPKKLAEATKRSKVTTFIASKSSRQEFVPLLGNLIDRAHVDPLHLKNNACALAHRFVLNEVLSLANLPNNISFSQVPYPLLLFLLC